MGVDVLALGPSPLSLEALVWAIGVTGFGWGFSILTWRRLVQPEAVLRWASVLGGLAFAAVVMLVHFGILLLTGQSAHILGIILLLVVTASAGTLGCRMAVGVLRRAARPGASSGHDMPVFRALAGFWAGLVGGYLLASLLVIIGLVITVGRS